MDQKKPLVGFALVAVLCAVLMSVSVDRGWAGDLLQPGTPIAAPVAQSPLEPPVETSTPEPAQVSLPLELSAQPLAAGAPVSAEGPADDSVATVPVKKKKSATERPDQPAQATPMTGTTAQSADRAADRKADRAAAKAQRQAEKAAAKIQRQMSKAAAKEQRQAGKAAAKAQRQADQAAAKAQRQAEKAERKADQAAEKAQRQAEKAAAKAERTAGKASKKG